MRTYKYFLIIKKWESTRTRWRAWPHPLSREKPTIFHSTIFVLCNGVAWWKVEERVPFEVPIHQVIFGGFVRDRKIFRVKRNAWLCNKVNCISNHRRDLVSRDQRRLSCHPLLSALKTYRMTRGKSSKRRKSDLVNLSKIIEAQRLKNRCQVIVMTTQILLANSVSYWVILVSWV